MPGALAITTERVDDVPLLMAQLVRMGVPRVLDAHFPMHGNWQGVSMGWVTTVWLTHLISQADHRMNQVEAWAATRQETLGRRSGQPVRPTDVNDDRLAAVLRALSDDGRWAAFEHTLTGQLVRVYDVQTDRVRVDSTSASSSGTVTAEGLLQFGHSKDHRPDLPQLKVMLATLDPLGLPLAIDVVSGERADDPLYLPVIARVRASLGRVGLSYVGDCKLAALATRASIAAAGDYYLCPLSARQWSAADLAVALQPVQAQTQPLTAVERLTNTGTPERIAEGFEWVVTQTSHDQQHPLVWSERWLLVRSVAYARAAEQALRTRLATAQAEIMALTVGKRGKRRVADAVALQHAVDVIRTRAGVTTILQVHIHATRQDRTVRGYGGRPPVVRQTQVLQVETTIDAAALTAAIAQLGWRVYVTNQPSAQLSLEQAILAYREEYLVERSLGRLKGHPLSLTPLYLQRDDHATGLVRLLAIALRALTLLEFVVRRHLQQQQEHLAGLYAGNPARATAQPTAERLLAAFRDLTLTVLHRPEGDYRHLTPLSPLQHRILACLALPLTLYTSLADHFPQPP
jgi:transposase